MPSRDSRDFSADHWQPHRPWTQQLLIETSLSGYPTLLALALGHLPFRQDSSVIQFDLQQCGTFRPVKRSEVPPRIFQAKLLRNKKEAATVLLKRVEVGAGRAP